MHCSDTSDLYKPTLEDFVLRYHLKENYYSLNPHLLSDLQDLLSSS